VKVKALPYLLLILSVSGFWACGPSEVDVNGQVFIVTQGGTNIKLGSVEIKAIDDSLISGFIKQRNQSWSSEYKKLKSSIADRAAELHLLKVAVHELVVKMRTDPSIAETKWETEDRVVAKEKELNALKIEAGRGPLGSFWVGGLPRAVQITKTDADGNFGVRLEPGKYALAAQSKRRVLDDTEEYYWLIWINVSKKDQNKVFLTNDNLFERFGPECVVKLSDIPF
jgi:hypothetical protein